MDEIQRRITDLLVVTNGRRDLLRLPPDERDEIRGLMEETPPAEAEYLAKMSDKELCGYVNRHYYNIFSELVDLPCQKEKGHSEEHGAFHFTIERTEAVEAPLDGVLTMQPGDVTFAGKKWASWTDLAGIPSEKIPVEPVRYPGEPPADLAKKFQEYDAEIQALKKMLDGDVMDKLKKLLDD